MWADEGVLEAPRLFDWPEEEGPAGTVVVQPGPAVEQMGWPDETQVERVPAYLAPAEVDTGAVAVTYVWPGVEPTRWWQRLRSAVFLIVLVVVCGVLLAAVTTMAALAVAAGLRRALG